MNIQKLMRQAKEMQDKMQRELSELVVEAAAGGGMVTVKMTGHKQLVGVVIDPEIVAANDPAMLKRTWSSIKEVMGPGALDARTKEMLYLAVSMSNSCDYCTVSHTAAARKAGMTDAMLHELIAIVGMANETNRLVGAYRVEPDEKLVEAAKGPKG